MEKRGGYVFLIDGGKKERGVLWRKGEQGQANRWGVGVNVSNSARITDTSAVHLRMFPISFKCFLQTCECTPGLPRQKKKKRGFVFDLLCVCVRESGREGGVSPFFIKRFYKLPKNFAGRIYSSTKEREHISTGAARKANKWLLMCSVSQTGKQMPSTHKSAQLLQASVDNYLYRN